MSSQDNSNSSNFQPNKSKRQLKNDDWTEVTEPEERRRIQNRIAQRKFREKTRENKERAEREARNRTHAAASYRIPTPSDIPAEPEVSGLPWGGISMAHVMSRGHDSSRNASGSSGVVNQQQKQPHQQQNHQQYMSNVAGNATGNPSMMGQYGQYGGTQGAEYGYEGMHMEQKEQEGGQ